MDIADNGEFRRRLLALGELFDAQLSPTKQALYFEALRDLAFADVARAMNTAVKGCTFMPKPAELRKLAVGDDEDAAERAWLAMRTAMRQAGAYSSLVVHDAALAETIQAMWTTWPEACAADYSPEMWSSKRKEFGRVYRAMCQRALSGGRYLAGLIEQQNAGYFEASHPTALVDGHRVLTLSAAAAESVLARLAGFAGPLRELDAGDGSEIQPPPKGAA